MSLVPIRSQGASAGGAGQRVGCAACSSPSHPRFSPCSPRARGDLPPKGGRLDLRTEVGRVPRARLPRRRRDPHPEPRREAARPLLPRARGPHQSAVPRALRRRWRDRHRPRGRARLRGPPAEAPPRRVAREEARRRAPGLDRALGHPLPQGSRAARRSLPRAARDPREGARDRHTPRLPHAGDDGPRGRRRLVPPLRRGRARRRDPPAVEGDVRAEQARHVQGEARARVRLRRRRVPLAQGRSRDGRGLAPPRAPRRGGGAPPRRRVGELHGGEAARARGVPRAVP